MEEIDEGQPEIEGNVDVPEENVILEQVTSSKTHECNPFMQFFSQRQTNFVFVMSSDMLFFVSCALLHDICLDVCLDRMKCQLEHSNKPKTTEF